MSARARIFRVSFGRAMPAALSVLAVLAGSSCVDPPGLPEMRVRLTGTVAIGPSTAASVALAVCLVPTGVSAGDASTDAAMPTDGGVDVVSPGPSMLPDDCRAPLVRRLASCSPCAEGLSLDFQVPPGRYSAIRVTAFRPHACRSGTVIQLPTASGLTSVGDINVLVGRPPIDVSVPLQPTNVTPSCP